MKIRVVLEPRPPHTRYTELTPVSRYSCIDLLAECSPSVCRGATVYLPPLFALFRLSARAMWPPLLNAKGASQEAHHTHQRIKPDPAIMPIRRIKS